MQQITINGDQWELVFRKLKKLCGDCNANTRTIRIATGMSEREELDTLIHEMLHAAGWHIDEDFVSRFATDAAKVLWDLGWRKDA